MNIKWDAKASLAIYNATKRSAVLRPAAMFFATSLLFVMMATVATVAVFDAMAKPESGLLYVSVWLGVPLVFSWLTSYVLQHMTRRRRPFQNGGGVPLITMTWIGPSFPSAHSAMAFTTAVVGTMAFQETFGAWLIVSAILVALSRVAVGVHFVSDVIVGAIIGAMIGAISGLLVSL
jgi:membrane-associated phospholipid phosphatase